MSRPRPSTTEPDPAIDRTVSAVGSTSDSLALTPEQMARWAALIARGEAEFPPSLTRAQEEQLRHEVRQQRRARLVQFIARQIARSLAWSAGPT
jgi:hypothetical protein